MRGGQAGASLGSWSRARPRVAERRPPRSGAGAHALPAVAQVTEHLRGAESLEGRRVLAEEVLLDGAADGVGEPEEGLAVVLPAVGQRRSQLVEDLDEGAPVSAVLVGGP